MESLIKADIFFFVSTISLVVLSLLFAVVLGLIIKILRDISDVAEMTKREVAGLVDDIHEIRSDVKSGVKATTRYAKAAVASVGIREALSFFASTMTDAVKKKRSRRRKHDEDE